MRIPSDGCLKFQLLTMDLNKWTTNTLLSRDLPMIRDVRVIMDALVHILWHEQSEANNTSEVSYY